MTSASHATGSEPAQEGSPDADAGLPAFGQWLRVTIRWTFMLGALFVVGPIAGSITGALRTADGDPHATALVSRDPVMGVGGMVLVFGLALAIGLPASRVSGIAIGFRSAGLVLAWAAWRTGEIDEVLRAAGSSGPLRALAAEGAIVGVLMIGLALALMLGGSTQRGFEREAFPSGLAAARRGLGRLVSPAALAAIAAGVVGGGLGAWIVAISPLRGQAVAAGIVAGVAGAAAGRLAGTAVDDEVPPLAYFIALGVLGVLGPLSAQVMHAGPAGVVEAAYTRELFAPARLLPLDWAAGAILGVPIGVHWAGSMTQQASRE